MTHESHANFSIALLFANTAAVPPAPSGAGEWLSVGGWVVAICIGVLVLWEKVQAFRNSAKEEGDEVVKKEDFDAKILKLETGLKETSEYMHKAVHDLRDNNHSTQMRVELVSANVVSMASKVDQIAIRLDPIAQTLTRIQTTMDVERSQSAPRRRRGPTAAGDNDS